MVRPGPGPADPLSRAVEALVTALSETKSCLLFSFLFGYSFGLQQRDGEALAPRTRGRHTGSWIAGLLRALTLGAWPRLRRPAYATPR